SAERKSPPADGAVNARASREIGRGADACGARLMAKDRVVAETDPALIEDLVDANHILFHLGVVDGFGHVSARDPKDPARFLISPSMAPALVTANDLMTIRIDGRPVSDDAPTPYLERFIHSEIYAARPDVVAVVHSHSAAIIPFSVVREASLKPLS